MSKLSSASDLLNLAYQKYNSRDFLEAIEAFRESLAIQENYHAYNALGVSLSNVGKLTEAIDAYQKGITFQKNCVGYCNLGWALIALGKLTEAIDALQKGVAVQEHWQIYHALGWAFTHNKQEEESIASFQKAVEFVDSSSTEALTCAYSALGVVYKKVGKLDLAIRCWEKQVSTFKPIIQLDPFLGNAEIYDQVDSERIEQVKSLFSDNGIDFIPSFAVGNNSFLESWKYLVYLHIRKCGGVTFSGPLYMLKNYLTNLHKQSSDLTGTYRYFNTCRHLVRSEEVPAYKNLISSDACKEFQSVFMTTHGSTWSELHQHISETIKAHPRIITTVRDPRKRLFSQIKHDAMIGEPIHHKAGRENSEYENVMYRNIFDYGLEGMFSSSEYGDGELKPEIFDQVDVIDIDDSCTINQIKSAFLGASLLPNIVHYSRLNDSSVHADRFNVSKEEIDSVYNRCLDQGFVAKDESIDYEFLKRKTHNRLHFPSLDNNSICKIHPLTFIIANVSTKDITAKDQELSIIPTKQLMTNPAQILEKFNL